jgi:hypothetical protein
MSEREDVCDRCGEPLELDPIHGTHFAPCENCGGGEDSDGPRGGEAAAYERDLMADIQGSLD